MRIHLRSRPQLVRDAFFSRGTVVTLARSLETRTSAAWANRSQWLRRFARKKKKNAAGKLIKLGTCSLRVKAPLWSLLAVAVKEQSFGGFAQRAFRSGASVFS